MKKSILFVFALLPLLASCNNNEKGFVNPFPEDKYNPTGFNFEADENTKNPLSTSENELLDKTIDKLDEINAKVIRLEEGEIQERDYTRAFAGVFKDGYDVSNMMYYEKFHSFYQEEDTNKYARKKTVTHVESTYDYSYGRNVSKTDYKALNFLAGDIDDATKKCNEVDNINNAKNAIIANYETNGSDNKFISAKRIEEGEGETLLPNLYVKQTIKKPLATDPIPPGVNSKGEVVLIEEKHNPYAETGIYELPDGRKYRAMENSLSVTILSKQKALDEPEIGEYYLVERARTYAETVITSNVIQPNVPIDFLKKPIVINYREEIHHFKTNPGEISDEDPLTDIEVSE